jgi:hypothetical protein
MTKPAASLVLTLVLACQDARKSPETDVRLPMRSKPPRRRSSANNVLDANGRLATDKRSNVPEGFQASPKPNFDAVIRP